MGEKETARESARSDRGFTALNDEQRQRAGALYVARDVLTSRSGVVTNTLPADSALDLYSLASYIETGLDPWPPRGDGERMPDSPLPVGENAPAGSKSLRAIRTPVAGSVEEKSDA